MGRYRNGVARVTEEADRAIHRALSAAEKAGEHVREAKALEMQAMQLAAYDDDDETSRATVAAARDVKTEVEGMVKEMLVLGGLKVDKVRTLAERAKLVAEEGHFEFTDEMVLNVGKMVERVVQEEVKVREKVEGVRGRLWRLSLGDDSG